MNDYAKKLETLIQNERDPIKRWHYRKILKEAVNKLESLRGRHSA